MLVFNFDRNDARERLEWSKPEMLVLSTVFHKGWPVASPPQAWGPECPPPQSHRWPCLAWLADDRPEIKNPASPWKHDSVKSPVSRSGQPANKGETSGGRRVLRRRWLESPAPTPRGPGWSRAARCGPAAREPSNLPRPRHYERSRPGTCETSKGRDWHSLSMYFPNKVTAQQPVFLQNSADAGFEPLSSVSQRGR